MSFSKTNKKLFDYLHFSALSASEMPEQKEFLEDLLEGSSQRTQLVLEYNLDIEHEELFEDNFLSPFMGCIYLSGNISVLKLMNNFGYSFITNYEAKLVNGETFKPTDIIPLISLKDWKNIVKVEFPSVSSAHLPHFRLGSGEPIWSLRICSKDFNVVMDTLSSLEESSLDKPEPGSINNIDYEKFGRMAYFLAENISTESFTFEQNELIKEKVGNLKFGNPVLKMSEAFSNNVFMLSFSNCFRENSQSAKVFEFYSLNPNNFLNLNLNFNVLFKKSIFEYELEKNKSLNFYNENFKMYEGHLIDVVINNLLNGKTNISSEVKKTFPNWIPNIASTELPIKDFYPFLKNNSFEKMLEDLKESNFNLFEIDKKGNCLALKLLFSLHSSLCSQHDDYWSQHKVINGHMAMKKIRNELESSFAKLYSLIEYCNKENYSIALKDLFPNDQSIKNEDDFIAAKRGATILKSATLTELRFKLSIKVNANASTIPKQRF